MRKVNLLPNIITAFALVCGLFVIFKTNIVEPEAGTYQVLHSSALLLLLAAFADVLDGAVARVIRAESEFGFVFDSLADVVSFGIAPSVLMLKNLSLEQGTGISFFTIVGAMLFSICGVLRLVRFNVKTTEVKRNAEAQAAHKKNFTGLPIPAGAMAAVGVNLFLISPLGLQWCPLSHDARAILLSCVMIVLGYLMISRWKFPSIKALHFRVPSFQLVFFTVIAAIFILYGILYYFPVMLVVVCWGYIVVSAILAIIRLIAGKKSHTLVDFEPEEDDSE
ncbi:MAG: CDP-alcohol phosphatidyltransferase family protein [Anaplasmataceae bacterium]|nr:CDP-alcohol phosphatidyltransferase family protein [Anaplasmataceae bacterium]